jgi:hypothetical protein
MIWANPKTFALMTAVIIAIVWLIVNYSYSTILSNKNSQIELLDRQIADLKRNPASNPTNVPRRLIEGQRRDMTERLRNGRSTISMMSDMACLDCGRYAADFESVLNDAEGWIAHQGGWRVR